MDATRGDSNPLRRSDYDIRFCGLSLHLSYGF